MSGKAQLKMLATGCLGMLVAVLAVIGLLSSLCAFSSGLGPRARMSFALMCLVCLALAVAGAVLIGHMNRRP